MPLGANPDTASSPGADTEDWGVTADSPTAGDVTAGSSPADDVTPGSSPEPSDGDAAASQESLADVVRRAAEGETTDSDTDATAETDDADASAADADTPADQRAQADADKETDGEAEEDDFSDVPFGKHPRFKQLLSQRNEFREQSETLKGELEQVRPQAEQYRQIESFTQEHGISPQEVAESFRIMALVKSDPAAARQALAEHLANLDEVTGHKLPPDLLDEVHQGRISEEHARELSRARSQARFQQQRVQQTEQRLSQAEQERQAREQQAAAQQAAAASQSAVQQEEQRLLAEDPDYRRMQPWVVRDLQARLAALPANQRPRTPDAAVKLFQASVDTVRRDLRQLAPPRPEVRPGATDAHSSASASTQPQPKSMREAILQAAQTQTP